MSESAPGRASGSSDASDKEFACDFCNTHFSSRGAKRRHERNFHNDELEYSCPTCSDGFHTLSGRNTHHKKVHGESISGVEMECERCNNTYRVPRSDSNRSRFCSKDCLYEHRSTVSGKEHELYNQIVVACANCGQKQERYPYEVEKSDNIFCDMECKGEWRSNNLVGEKHPSWVNNTAIFECEQCGDEYEYPERQADRTRFCSRDCLANWQSENLSRENSVHHKGGYEGWYGPNWPSQKQSALSRDQYRCQRCLKSENELGQKPDVHHLKRIMWYKENYEAPEWYEVGNRLENLVCLCRSCHKRWEGIPLRPQ